MKKIVLIMTMVFGLIATAFAYDEVWFNNDGTDFVDGLNTVQFGLGHLESDGLMMLNNISKDNLKEVPADRDTYCLFYNIIQQYGYDWVILESKNYIAWTVQNHYGWREYRIFKKTGSKAGKYLYKPIKLKTWAEIVATETLER